MSAPKEEMLERVSELSIHNCHTISPASEEAMKENTRQLDQSSGHRNSVNANNNKKKKKKKTSTQEKLLPSQKLVETNFPWKALNRPGRGRCAVASRNIKAGEVVVAEQAVAFMPRAHYHSAICHSCCCDFTKNSDRVKCSSCQNVFHCKTCEEKALPQHRKWCSVYKEINRIAKESDCDQDLVHFVLSLFSKKYSDPDNNRKVVGVESINVGGKVEDGIIKSSFQDVLGLQTHQSKMPKAWRNSVQKACQALQILIMNECEGDLDCSVGELEWLAALVNTNAHGMGAQGLRNTDVALGIFPFVSMLNHSCRPNCCFASEGNVMFVRAIQDISTDNELCVSYINLYEPRSTRKHELSVTKYFDCNCQRCMEPLESSLDRFLEGCMCNVKGCDGVLLKSSLDGHVLGDGKLTPWICDTCSRVLDPMSFDAKGKQIAETPWVLVGKAEEQMAIAMSAYRERRLKDARALLEKFNGDFSGKLHHLHVLLFDSLTPLMNCHRAVGDAEGGVRVCRRILSCLEKVLPNSSLELANFYSCLGEMCFERAEASDISPVLAKHYKKQAHEAFQHVRQIRKICLGKLDLPNQ